ncbi:AraC family transcriptional regulator [Shewanella sp. MEBiC00475]|uniref:AraC family transcriptional regulator n=1 Tax=Shewanella sp. MEBiC00475 TaxID=2575361 RepID=UPI0010BF6B6A|nr:AraC family transcriptional regulator [Shewanella sp. MEBiC00475]
MTTDRKWGTFLTQIFAATVLIAGLFALPAQAEETKQGNGALASELEDIKSQVLKLNRDLFILEEDLLFPASTQIAVFVSVDVGRFLKLDSVELKIDDNNVSGFLYTERQRKALEQGGIQRIYLGNLKMGPHQLTAIFTGNDAEGRTVQRAISHSFDKTDETVMIELKVEDSESSYRADIKVEQWVL